MKSFFVFIELAFSFLIYIRILNELRTQKLANNNVFGLSIGIFLLWVLGWSYFPQINTLKISFLVWLPTILLYFIPNWIMKRHKKQFQREFISLLNQLILQMNNGLALRPALLVASKDVSDFSRIKIEKIIDQLSLQSAQKTQEESDELARYLIKYLGNVEKDAHLSVKRIMQLRDRYKIEDQFVSRKNRALQPAIAQVFVLTALYILTFGYVVLQPGSEMHIKIISWSLLLYFMGAILAYKLSRSFKWTV